MHFRSSVQQGGGYITDTGVNANGDGAVQDLEPRPISDLYRPFGGKKKKKKKVLLENYRAGGHGRADRGPREREVSRMPPCCSERAGHGRVLLSAAPPSMFNRLLRQRA